MSQHYVDYFLSQQQGGSIDDIGQLYKSKRINQTGFGLGYSPILIQNGHGIGNFLYGLYRMLNPLIVSGMNAIKSEAFNTGKNILSDIGKKSLKNIITEHGSQAIQNLKLKAENKVSNMQGKGVCKKGHIKKKIKRKYIQSMGKSSQEHHIKKKKRVLDLFD